ncbi:MAG: PKD domain-containing protein [Methanoregulaceae archaeon]
MKKIPLRVCFSILLASMLVILPASAVSTPVAAFVSNAMAGTAPLTVLFIDQSTNAPTLWLWSFGDGNTSTIESPSHTYTVAGTYTVTLTATNSAGSNTLTRSGYITVSKLSSTPTAAFVANVTSGTEPLSVQFVDSSTNSPALWLWSFGDGGSSTTQNPSHTYTSAGNYTVTLTVTNAAGSNTISQSGYIIVSKVATTPVASFVATETSGPAPLTIQFVDSSTNFPTLWLWSFGDGGSSTTQNPSHTYTSSGTYTVTLTATNEAGSNTVTQTNYITVNPSSPIASFTASITNGTAPLTVNFTDTSTNSPTGWSWYFGDGGTSINQTETHTYTGIGTYTVELTVYNSVGSNATTVPDYITVTKGPTLPDASFTADVAQGSVPLTVQFTDTSSNSPTSWAWSFGDGITSTLQNPSHTYTSAGTYTVVLTATNSIGSNTDTRNKFITASVAVMTTTVPATTYTITTTTPAPMASETSAVTGLPTGSAAGGSSWIPVVVVIIALIGISIASLIFFKKQRRGLRRPGNREI